MKVKEFYKKWYFKTQGIECGEPLSNELVIIKFAEEFAAEQNKALKEKAEKVVEVYILTTPTDNVSGSTMVVSKLAKPIIELNEELNKH
jgi:hypothetical protein